MLDQKLKYRRFKGYLEQVLGRTFTDDEYDNIAETLRVCLEQSVMMGYRYDKAVLNNPGYADELFTLWITNQNDTQHLLDVMEIVANQNPNQPPVPPSTGAGWRELVECRNPISPYFSVEWPLMGTYGYQGGDMSSEIYEYPHTLKHSFQSESVIMIQDGIVLLENYGPERKGAIWYAGAIRWLAPGSLCLECHKHGDRWYVTWGDWWQPNQPGGWAWSLDKINWHDGGRMTGSDMCFGMCSHVDLYSAGSAYLDWGFDQSYPVLYRNSQRVDALPNRKGDGAWAAETFNGHIFCGICGHAAVWCPGVGIVLEMSGFTSIHSFMKLDGMLLALVNLDSDKYDKGAVIMQSPTGDRGSWTPRGEPFSSPMLFHGQGRKVVGGRFNQKNDKKGFGKAYDLT